MRTPPEPRAEIVVVGAGVIGLAVACELLRRGRSVVVLERDEGGPGLGATRAAAGMLAPVSEAETDSETLLAFGHDSRERYPEFVRALEDLTGVACGYRRDGTLWVALDRDDVAELDHLAETLRSKGLAAEKLDGAGVRDLEPHLSHRVVGGLLVRGDHQVDPRRLAQALAAAVRKMGGEIRTGFEVDSIEQEDGRVRAVCGRDPQGRRFEMPAGTVVLAAGAWSEHGLRSPSEPLGLRPVKGQLVRLRGPRLLTRVVRTPRVYLVPREDGELLVGATMEEMGFETTKTAGAALDLLRHGFEALPGLYDLELAEISVGLRSAVDDHLPVIGEYGTAGLFAAFGHYRNGILLAPATAWHLAEWIESGRAPAALEPFAPERRARASTIAVRSR